MSWRVPWPSDDLQLLAWAQTLLVWCAAHYAVGTDPVGRVNQIDGATEQRSRRFAQVRSLAAATAVACVPGWTLAEIPARLALAAMTVGLGLILARFRLRMALSKYLAEWEVGVNVAFATGSGLIVGSAGIEVAAPLIRLPVTAGQLAAVSLWAAVLVFSAAGGTHVVRGLLNKAGTLPIVHDKNTRLDPGTTGDPSNFDVPEYNRGRIIGNFERFLMIVMVVSGSYEGLGLLVAAKGLIRAREFEDRDFAEYFIVGSLASVTVALVLGLALRYAVAPFWAR